MPNSPVRILLVDDDPLIRELVERSLAPHFEPAVFANAEDGAEGLARCLSQPFDLVVTDICMPRLSGIEMLVGVRGQGIETPVIVLSGSELPREDLSSAGAFVYLSKLELKRLPALARQLLDVSTAPVQRSVAMQA